jgi:hypothetical protein
MHNDFKLARFLILPTVVSFIHVGANIGKNAKKLYHYYSRNGDGKVYKFVMKVRHTHTQVGKNRRAETFRSAALQTDVSQKQQLVFIFSLHCALIKLSKAPTHTA